MTRRTDDDATGRAEPPGEPPRPSGMAIPRRRCAAALAVLVVLAGCAQPGTAEPPAGTPEPSAELPADPVTPVLRVEHVGGFVPAGWTFARIPLYSVCADGRLI